MCANEELLIAVQRCAETGRDALDRVLPAATGEFRREAEQRREKYKRLYMAADSLLKAGDGDDSGVPALRRAADAVRLEVKALRDRSAAGLAAALLTTTDRGLLDISTALAQLQLRARPQTVNLAAELRRELIADKEALQRWVGQARK